MRPKISGLKMLRLNNYVAVELYEREKLLYYIYYILLYDVVEGCTMYILGQLILSQLNTVNNIG